MNTGKIIAQLEEEKGWSQTDLADKGFVSRVMIGIYERGETAPSIEATKKIADVLEASLDYFVGEGINAQFDIKTVRRVQDIESLALQKHKPFFLIETVIRDNKAKQAYAV